MPAVTCLVAALLVQRPQISPLERALANWNARVEGLTTGSEIQRSKAFANWEPTFESDVLRLDDLRQRKQLPSVSDALQRGVDAIHQGFESSSLDLRRAAIHFAATYGGFYEGDVWIVPSCIYTFRGIYGIGIDLDSCVSRNQKLAIPLLDDPNPIVVANIAACLSDRSKLMAPYLRKWTISPTPKLRSLAFELMYRDAKEKDQQAIVRQFLDDPNAEIRGRAEHLNARVLPPRF